MRWITIAVALTLATGVAAQDSSGLLVGTHAAVTLGGHNAILRKNAGSSHVTTVAGRPGTPNFAALATTLKTEWGDPNVRFQAMSLGIDPIIVEPDEVTVVALGESRTARVAVVDETHGWVALQFTVESDVSGLGTAPEIIAADGADATKSVYSFVFPGSTLGGSAFEEGVRRSLTPAEGGFTENITAFNAHIAFYLLDAGVSPPYVSYGLPEYPTFYFTVNASAGLVQTGRVYATTWSGGSWGALSTIHMGIGDRVIDGLAVDASRNAIVFSTSVIDATTPSELMFQQLMVGAEADDVPAPAVYAARDPAGGGVHPVGALLGDVPVGDICDRDPMGAMQVYSPKDCFLDSFVVAHYGGPALTHGGLFATGLRTVGERRRPMMLSYCSVPRRALGTTLELETWVERWIGKSWKRAGPSTVQKVVASRSLVQATVALRRRPLPGPRGKFHRIVGRWSLPGKLESPVITMRF